MQRLKDISAAQTSLLLDISTTMRPKRLRIGREVDPKLVRALDAFALEHALCSGAHRLEEALGGAQALSVLG